MKQKNKIKVLVADDHDIYLDGLTALLCTYPEIELVGSAKDGKELMEMADRYKPDVILTDLRMPVVDGITAIRLISISPRPVPMVALSNYDDDGHITEAMEAGAKGYIIKNSQKGEIIDAIRTVYSGHDHYSPATSLKLKISLSKSKLSPGRIAVNDLYSPREKEIIRMICQQRSNREIGERLFMGKRTVEGKRKKIMEKMGVDNSVGVALYAVKNGLFNIEELR